MGEKVHNRVGSAVHLRCSVAVLQFQNRLYESQKLTLYLYINIEVFLGYGNSLKRTATLQQLQQTLSNYSGKISQKNEENCRRIVYYYI